MKYLFQKIDNSQLVIFRILYGLILFVECAGAIAVGWVKDVFDVPEFTFTFIGFEFLKAPELPVMYAVYGFMALLGLMVAFGFYYRISTVLFALFWTWTYLMHKVHYNNHHYLMFLLNWIFVLIPAHHYRSVDVKRGLVEERLWCYRWHVVIFIALLGIAYTYAAIAKMYPDWLKAIPLKGWLQGRSDMPIMGFIYKQKITAYFMAWGGILFDLLVIPCLLWKPTRKWAFFISVFFHLSNSITFQIGTFPYTMIAASVLFFPRDKMRRIFLKKKEYYPTTETTLSPKNKWVGSLVFAFLAIQVLLPLRHHLIEDNVFWTEEGHRLSWRMMLRAKGGSFNARIYKDGERIYHNVIKDLSRSQYQLLMVKTDIMWQYIQHLKKVYGPDVEIYVESKVQLNMHPYYTFIKPDYDMAKAKWNYFGHADWLMPFNGWNDEGPKTD